jgi:hypothetical protein
MMIKILFSAELVSDNILKILANDVGQFQLLLFNTYLLLGLLASALFFVHDYSICIFQLLFRPSIASIDKLGLPLREMPSIVLASRLRACDTPDVYNFWGKSIVGCRGSAVPATSSNKKAKKKGQRGELPRLSCQCSERCGLESSSASTWRATREEAQDGDQDTGTDKRDDDGPNQSVGTQANEARQETSEKCADDANDDIANDTITTTHDHTRQETRYQADDQPPEHR